MNENLDETNDIDDILKNLNKNYPINGYEFIFEDGELILVYNSEFLEKEKSIFDLYLEIE